MQANLFCEDLRQGSTEDQYRGGAICFWWLCTLNQDLAASSKDQAKSTNVVGVIQIIITYFTPYILAEVTPEKEAFNQIF